MTCLNDSGGHAAGSRRVPLIYPQIQIAVRPTDTVVSKWTKDLVITITSADGKLRRGENEFCILFQKRDTRDTVDVQNVSIDFALLVGKIHEKPIKPNLAWEQQGRYCGRVELGKQYYIPATYYAFLLHTDSAGKKRERVSLTVR
jgi:hypothetical protein